MLSKQIQEYIKTNRQVKESIKGIELTPELLLQSRGMVDQMLGSIPVPENIEYQQTKISDIPGEFYKYTGNRDETLNDKVVLFIHGGGFATGSVTSRRYLCTTALNYAELDGFSIEYSQYPEVKHPTALNECIKVFKDLQDKGYSPENIYLYGESAGALLALTMTHYLKDHSEPLPGKICIYSSPINLKDDYDSRADREDRDPILSGKIREQLTYFSPEEDFESPYISPVFGDFTGFPEIKINVGTEEVLWDDCIELKRKCEEAGVKVTLRIWDELFHVFTMFPTPESELALKEDGEFLRK